MKQIEMIFMASTEANKSIINKTGSLFRVKLL